MDSSHLRQGLSKRSNWTIRVDGAGGSQHRRSQALRLGSERSRTSKAYCRDSEFRSRLFELFSGPACSERWELVRSESSRPAFFLLRQSTQLQSSSWQPLDQTLEALATNGTIRKCISESQLGHICMSLCNDQTDNIPYFKFSEKLAVQWLHKKQEMVYQVLLRQEMTREDDQKKFQKRRPKGSSPVAAGGSVSSTFYTPEDEMAAKPVKTSSHSSSTISPKTLQNLKMESLQIVCNYLSEEWTTKLIESYEMSEQEVFPVTEKKSVLDSSASATTCASVSSRDTDTTGSAKDTPKSKNIELARSVANKRLEKVNKRGMSALTSFFQPKAKKQGL